MAAQQLRRVEQEREHHRQRREIRREQNRARHHEAALDLDEAPREARQHPHPPVEAHVQRGVVAIEIEPHEHRHRGKSHRERVRRLDPRANEGRRTQRHYGEQPPPLLRREERRTKLGLAQPRAWTVLLPLPLLRCAHRTGSCESVSSTARVAVAMSPQSKRSAVRTAASDIRARSSGSAITRASASRTDSVFVSTKKPFTPCSTKSSSPFVRTTMSGSPHAADSSPDIENVS